MRCLHCYKNDAVVNHGGAIETFKSLPVCAECLVPVNYEATPIPTSSSHPETSKSGDEYAGWHELKDKLDEKMKELGWNNGECFGSIAEMFSAKHNRKDLER